MKLQLVGAACAALLSGCATVSDNLADFRRSQSESNPAGVKGLLEGDELRYLRVSDLVWSFVPGNRPVTATGSTAADEQTQTDIAIAAFYSTTQLTDDQRAFLRNEIEDRIIAASNQRCHLWENYLTSSASTVDFWSGLFGTAASAASTAFSPRATKNALSALSTTSTAVGTEYDKNYLYSETLFVIFQGVEGRRQSILTEIRGKQVSNGEPMPITSYSLSAAIGDALAYHGACSMASGLQQASETMADQRGGGTTEAGAPGVTAQGVGATPSTNATPPPPATTKAKPTASPASAPL